MGMLFLYLPSESGSSGAGTLIVAGTKSASSVSTKPLISLFHQPLCERLDRCLPVESFNSRITEVDPA